MTAAAARPPVWSLRRNLALFLIALAACVAGAAWSPLPASAGEVHAGFCPGAQTPRFPAHFIDLGGGPWLDLSGGCHAAGNGVAGLYQDRDGAPAGNGQSGRITWDTPPEVSIIKATGRVRMKEANGIKTALTGQRNGVTERILAGSELNGSDRTFEWAPPGSAGSSLAIAISCSRSGGCLNRPDSVKSFVQVDRLEITGQDRTSPSVEQAGELAELAANGSWAGGSVGWRALAQDAGTGIHDLHFLVNGFTVSIPKILCHGLNGGVATELAPCPATRIQSGLMDTTSPPFRDGVNDVRLCASDYSGDPHTANLACSARAALKVDGRPPAPPVELETDQGSGWSARDRFAFDWSLPEDSGSPVNRAFYRLRSVQSGYVVASGTTAADPAAVGDSTEVKVPEPGEYRLEVGLIDQAGNRGAVTTAPIRFDDRPPPDVMPTPPSGWISRSELPLSQTVMPVHGAGVSGLAGFAFATSDLGPQTPCRASLCRLPELSWLGGPDDGPALLDGLIEGENQVSVVAVSGAWVPSRTPGVTTVRVDMTDPVVRVTASQGDTGSQSGWSNRPVTLTATATDRLSGMRPDPSDTGVPVTGVGAVGSEPEVSTGDTASVTIVREGSTEVDFFARDLAGNSTRPTVEGEGRRNRTVVRIDTTPPVLRFGPVGDPLDPEKVVALVDDSLSGPADGEISIGPSNGRADFRTLSTTLEAGRLRARVPSDDLPPGEYVLRAEATDGAGNRTVTTADTILRLPLKAEASLSLNRERPSRRGSGPVLAGRLSVGSGQIGPETRVVIEESFSVGSGLPERTRAVSVGSDGSFTVQIDPGPSRLVRAVFPGNRLNGRTASRWVSVDFRDRVRFTIRGRVTRNRMPTRMSGSVSGLGVPVPSRGKKVVIQYFDPSRRVWRPVEIVTSGPSGTFSFTYRFMTITSRQRILFRAVSLGEAGWPFTPSASRAVSVVVLP